MSNKKLLSDTLFQDELLFNCGIERMNSDYDVYGLKYALTRTFQKIIIKINKLEEDNIKLKNKLQLYEDANARESEEM